MARLSKQYGKGRTLEDALLSTHNRKRLRPALGHCVTLKFEGIESRLGLSLEGAFSKANLEFELVHAGTKVLSLERTTPTMYDAIADFRRESMPVYKWGTYPVKRLVVRTDRKFNDDPASKLKVFSVGLECEGKDEVDLAGLPAVLNKAINNGGKEHAIGERTDGGGFKFDLPLAYVLSAEYASVRSAITSATSLPLPFAIVPSELEVY